MQKAPFSLMSVKSCTFAVRFSKGMHCWLFWYRAVAQIMPDSVSFSPVLMTDRLHRTRDNPPISCSFMTWLGQVPSVLKLPASKSKIIMAVAACTDQCCRGAHVGFAAVCLEGCAQVFPSISLFDACLQHAVCKLWCARFVTRFAKILAMTIGQDTIRKQQPIHLGLVAASQL